LQKVEVLTKRVAQTPRAPAAVVVPAPDAKEQSQKEITALKQQVEVLTKRVEQTPVAPAPGVVPAPDAKDVVVMQQPARNRSRRGGAHRVEENARIRRGNDAIVRVCIIGFGLAIAAIVPGGGYVEEMEDLEPENRRRTEPST
jgi:hypothetical protein